MRAMTYVVHMVLVTVLHGGGPACTSPINSAPEHHLTDPAAEYWRSAVTEAEELSDSDNDQRTIVDDLIPRVAGGRDSVCCAAVSPVWAGHADAVAAHAPRGPPAR